MFVAPKITINDKKNANQFTDIQNLQAKSQMINLKILPPPNKILN